MFSTLAGRFLTWFVTAAGEALVGKAVEEGWDTVKEKAAQGKAARIGAGEDDAQASARPDAPDTPDATRDENPDENAAINRNRGDQYMESRRFQDALSAYQAATELEPQNPVNYDKQARAFAALENYTKAFNQSVQAIAFAEAHNAPKAQYYFNKGLALYLLKDYSAASKAFERALDIQSEEPFRFQSERSLYCVGFAAAQFSDGRVERALAMIRKELKSDKNNPLLHSLLGIMLMGNPAAETSENEAKSEFEQATSFDPKNALYHYLLGMTLYQLDDEGAEEELERAAQLDDNNAEYHYSYGMYGNGGWEELQRAAQLDDNNAEYHYRFGEALLEGDNYEEAAEEFEKATQRASKDDAKYHDNLAEYYDSLSSALAFDGQLEKALEASKHAVNLDSQNIAYHFNYAWRLRDLNKNDEAERAFQETIKLSGSSSNAISELCHSFILGLKAQKRRKEKAEESK